MPVGAQAMPEIRMPVNRPASPQPDMSAFEAMAADPPLAFGPHDMKPEPVKITPVSDGSSPSGFS